MNIVAGSLLFSLVLGVCRPVVVPGAICAAPDGLSVGEEAHFTATCCDEKYAEKVAADSGLILFAFNRYRLSASAWLTIHSLQKKIMSDTALYNVDGHACVIGTELYNFKLSVKRANAVRDALISLGVPANRLISRGFGKSKAIGAFNDEARRALDRRVEVHGVEVRPVS